MAARGGYLNYALLVVPILLTMNLTRPLADTWPDTVTRLRNKDRSAVGTFRTAFQPVQAALKDKRNRWSTLSTMLSERLPVRTVGDLEVNGTWAADAVLVTLGCTKKRCYCGVLGVWRPLPGPQADLWVLLAGHAAGCATAYAYGQGFFFRLFSPRFREPYTLLLSLFATSTPWECLWLYGMLFSTGPALQRILGRVGFAVLYLGGAACSTLLSAVYRHSATGTGGPLAIATYHTLLAPYARHSIFGIEMGARAALAVQIGICSWPALSGNAPLPALLLALNGLPVLFGALAWQLTGG